jgi:hypothetical protein
MLSRLRFPAGGFDDEWKLNGAGGKNKIASAKKKLACTAGETS